MVSWIAPFTAWSMADDRRRAGTPPILFVHVPKTAGTSMRQMFQVSLGKRAVYPSNTDIRRRRDGGYPSAAEILRDQATTRPYQVLIGHFVAGIQHRLDRPHRAATMLREPMQRSLSMLAHLHRHRGLSPEAVLDDEGLRTEHITDYQTRLLGADVERDFEDVSDASLERALRMLEAFEFVGITERFAESCRLFDARFGTTISSTPLESNVLRPGGRGYEEFIPRIEPLVTRDRVLYERACARFDRDLRSLPAVSAGTRRAA